MRRHTAGVVVLALLVGCSATGAKVTEDQLLQFQKGSTTLDQVVAKLGRPTTTMLMPNGERMIMYTYAQIQVRPATYIPIVGAFAGGADSKSNSATLIFDTSGVLKSYSASSSAFGSGLSVSVNTFNTGKLPDHELLERTIPNVRELLRPKSIIERLQLREPGYQRTAAFGAFGRTDVDLAWEHPLEGVEQCPNG